MMNVIRVFRNGIDIIDEEYINDYRIYVLPKVITVIVIYTDQNTYGMKTLVNTRYSQSKFWF